MRLHTPYTYSLAQFGHPATYPPLDRDRDTDVLVLGTGISAALTAWQLTKDGRECLLIDRRAAATGSTAASTSLLQYELDTPLHELAKIVGAGPAARSYQLCYEAIGILRNICAEAGVAHLFEPRPSLQFASYRTHLPALQEEQRQRRALGFDEELLGPDELRARFGIDKPGGLLSANAAQIDAYALSHALLRCILERGGAVHEHTEAVDIERTASGVVVRTAAGHRIRARALVIACGYESQRYLPQPVEELFVTYALLTKPLSVEAPWWRKSLIWETAHPYLYSRTTPENRLIIGGKDIRYDGRPYDRGLPTKTRALLASFQKLMPHLQLEAESSWAGIFAGTRDGLPYIGTAAAQPHTYYALGFGGNGILFSVLAARIISALITRGQHPDAALFSFSRR